MTNKEVDADNIGQTGVDLVQDQVASLKIVGECASVLVWDEDHCNGLRPTIQPR